MKRIGQAFIFASTLTLQAGQSQASTRRKRQSTPSVGYTDCAQDVEVTFSPTGLSSTLYLCSGKANLKIESPKATHASPKTLLAGLSLPIPGVK